MHELRLDGIDGQNLWGFLTALGTLRLLHTYARKHNLGSPRLWFDKRALANVLSPVARERLPAELLSELSGLQPFLEETLALINNPSDFTHDMYKIAAGDCRDPVTTDFLAGLACVIDDECSASTLCAANGAGHQSLVRSMRDVLKLVGKEHLEHALFEPWTKSFRMQKDEAGKEAFGDRKPTLRFDPADERLYALRYSDPTEAKDYSTELGAQALAVPAFGVLPLLPRAKPVTVASKRRGTRVTFTWPLWSAACALPTVQSLLWQGPGIHARDRVQGVFATFSADRVSGERGKLSFAPSRGEWWSNPET